MTKEQVTAIVGELVEKDVVDYISIFAPLLLSILMAGFTIYATMILPKKRKFTASLYWDDLMCRYVVLIINQGNVSIVIDKVRLFIKTDDGELNLGDRRCVCDSNGKIIVIESGQACSFIPTKGSIYDVFGYKGHYFDVTDDNKLSKVYIEAIDIKGKKCTEQTDFTLEEIDEQLIYHRNAEFEE